MAAETRNGNDESKQANAWLRGVLTAVSANASLPEWAEKRMTSAVRRLPDWHIAKWGTALHVDYIDGYRAYPDLAHKAETDAGRAIIQGYLETHNALAAIISLRRLVQTVLRLHKQGNLPVSKGVIQRQVCALGWASCTAEGMKFARDASAILHRDEEENHLLDNYRLALERSEVDRLRKLDNLLTAGLFGKWVMERLDEATRWLDLDMPQVKAYQGFRTPLWESLWQRMLTGGAYDRHSQ